MKKIVSTISLAMLFNLGFAQSLFSNRDFRHEFTDFDDSVVLKGLKLYLEIDSVYKVNDSSGVVFSIETTIKELSQIMMRM